MIKQRRPIIMKWGTYNLHAGEKVNRFFGKLLNKRGFYCLLMIVTLGLALGAGVKWHP